jgi:hypothetical protein
MATYNDALFRAQFPEFADTVAYPAAMLSGYFTMAQLFIVADGSPCASLQGDQLQLALNQMTAHLMILGQQAATGVPGTAQGGFETSASIGEISVQKLAPPAADAWQWWLVQTTYGQALSALLSVLATGGLSVGGMSERSSFRKAGGCFW